MDYTFGLFERCLGASILLAMWGLLSVLSVTLVAEHTADATEFHSAMGLASYFMLAAILLLFFARPVLSALPEVYGRAKQVIA